MRGIGVIGVQDGSYACSWVINIFLHSVMLSDVNCFRVNFIFTDLLLFACVNICRVVLVYLVAFGLHFDRA